MNEDEQFEAWLERLSDLYSFAVADRLRELNGDRVSGWRKDGLHQWSHSWGALDALTPDWLLDAMSEAHDQLAISPKQLREVADADATDEFTRRLLARERASASASDRGNRGR